MLVVQVIRSIRAREEESTNDKRTKGYYQVRKYLNDVFGFAGHQEIVTYGLGYKLTMHRNSDINVLGHESGVGASDVDRRAAKEVKEEFLII